ncbi:aldo/keto reductase [Alteromonas lipolytica]|uniref:2,5-diketo-D-gluconic acid reductase n=1 Tax=Alteromonas lipolytica TaxID=1856405 RepID=A0A1E8FGZ0_9ALTE|nr:aldo/keto reductase [Alteromonas lipolytica]OFI35205.1 2,5-diketo-D-gluconic acid reductase [Alteromonas lipolytica]GGF57610.1 2,5-diketo-D-gluconic acid reductase [Alteromonas lipolytica]
MLNDYYTLANNVNIPKIGLGTWMIEDDDVEQVVIDAVKAGYRHIDTAQAYQNEAGVGRGIKACGVPREELFITTKLAAEAKTYEEAKQAIDESLAKIDAGYIDMMIIHSPQPWANFGDDDRYFDGNLQAWKALEEAYKAGKLKAIGLSNFQQQDIENILKHCEVKPVVNQLLAHASNTPFELIEYVQKQEMLVEAYSPVGHGELFKNDTITEMAKKYGVSVPQLAIRYDLQLGLLPLPKSTNPDHMKNNADVEFEISKEDMETLKNLPKIKDYGDASNMPVFQ